MLIFCHSSCLQLSNENSQRIGAKLDPKVFKTGMKVAQALQMLIPGTPVNYYGDEFGVKGGILPDVSGKYVSISPLNLLGFFFFLKIRCLFY